MKKISNLFPGKKTEETTPETTETPSDPLLEEKIEEPRTEEKKRECECPSCGAIVSRDAAVCQECGEEFETENQPTVGGFVKIVKKFSKRPETMVVGEKSSEPVKQPSISADTKTCKIISIMNQKGGVGSTTTAVNLSAVIASKGKKTLLIDIDPKGNSTGGVGIDKNKLEKSVYNALIKEKKFEDIIIHTKFENLDIAPSNIQLTKAEIELEKLDGSEKALQKAMRDIIPRYDYIFIDSPSSFGILTLNSLAAAKSVIIPTQCEYYALEGISQAVEIINLVQNKLNPPLRIEGILLTMHDARSNLSEQVIHEMKSYFKDKVYKTVIPRNVRVSEAPGFGKPIMYYAPHSTGARAYESLSKEVMGLGFHPEKTKQLKKRRDEKKKEARPMRVSNYEYDVAFSYAGENRAYVEVVAKSTAGKIKIFYDRYEKADLWGKDLAEYFGDIYGKKSRFCLMFISKHYVEKQWPIHERKYAINRAIKERGMQYILPVRFDDTDVPGLNPSVCYLYVKDVPAEKLAANLLEKCMGEGAVKNKSAYAPTLETEQKATANDVLSEEIERCLRHIANKDKNVRKAGLDELLDINYKNDVSQPQILDALERLLIEYTDTNFLTTTPDNAVDVYTFNKILENISIMMRTAELGKKEDVRKTTVNRFYPLLINILKDGKKERFASTTADILIETNDERIISNFVGFIIDSSGEARIFDTIKSALERKRGNIHIDIKKRLKKELVDKIEGQTKIIVDRINECLGILRYT